MAGRSTALIAVGNYTRGPFASRDWNAKHIVALFEKHRPVWVTSPVGATEYGAPPQESTVFPFGWTLAEELLVVVAACAVKDADMLSSLANEGLTAEQEGLLGPPQTILRIDDHRADGPPLPISLVELAASRIRDVVRLGLVRLEPETSLGDDSLVELRGYGLDVDDYQLQPLGRSPDE